MDYDLLIIGTEREGIERAIFAAQNGSRVAIIGEPRTVPTMETMRRAAETIVERREVTIQAWRAEVRRLTDCQTVADRAEIECLGIDWIPGQVRLTSPNEVQITSEDDVRVFSSHEMMIATGSQSWCPNSFYRDQRFILDFESLLTMDKMPQTMIVVGAGRTGLALANILAMLGVEVLVIDEKFSLAEMSDLLGSPVGAFQTFDIAFRLGEEVIGTELRHDMKAGIRLASGKVLTADFVLLCMGRQGMTQNLGLEAVGVGVDERGRVWCAESGKTWVPHIKAVGDLMGVHRSSGSHPVESNRIGSLFSRNLSSTAEGRKVAVGLNRA